MTVAIKDLREQLVGKCHEEHEAAKAERNKAAAKVRAAAKREKDAEKEVQAAWVKELGSFVAEKLKDLPDTGVLELLLELGITAEPYVSVDQDAGGSHAERNEAGEGDQEDQRAPINIDGLVNELKTLLDAGLNARVDGRATGPFNPNVDGWAREDAELIWACGLRLVHVVMDERPSERLMTAHDVYQGVVIDDKPLVESGELFEDVNQQIQGYVNNHRDQIDALG